MARAVSPIATTSQQGSSESLTRSQQGSSSSLSPQSSSESLSDANPFEKAPSGRLAESVLRKRHTSQEHLQSPTANQPGLLRRMSSVLTPSRMHAALQRRRISLTPTSREKGLMGIVLAVVGALFALWFWDTYVSGDGRSIRVVRGGSVEWRKDCGDVECEHIE